MDVTALTVTQVMVVMVELLVLGGFSYMAFKWPHAVIFMLTGAVSYFEGMYIRPTLQTPQALVISLCLIAYCFLCFGLAFKLMFWAGQEEEE